MFDDFYGLSGRPFQLTPDPSFYFESLTHRKALSYLSYGLAQGEGFVVITGEVGAGKSTLVAHLMSTVDPGRLTAAQIVTSKLGGEELVHVVARSFGLSVEGHDKASALAAIEGFLHDEARAGRRTLLIVDESQNLSIEALEELRMLSNFQLGSHPLLQTLLLGQPEFREALLEHPALEQLRQRVIAIHHLDAMEANEVQPYIEHRMKRVGWQGNPSFDQRVFAEIQKLTGGVPRRINQIVTRLLLLGAVDQRSRIDCAMLQQVLSELNEDGTVSVVRSAAKQTASNAVASALQIGGGPAGESIYEPTQEPTDELANEAAVALHERDDGVDLKQVQAALAERDAQIAELQQAVLELANSVEGPSGINAGLVHSDEISALNERLAVLENRLAEQDRTIRHTLTMLIEWIEEDVGHRAAA
jgi:putative secretion ATPase (PEP-CTERM system associated)